MEVEKLKRKKVMREWSKEVAKWKLGGNGSKFRQGSSEKHLKWPDFENGKIGGWGLSGEDLNDW